LGGAKSHIKSLDYHDQPFLWKIVGRISCEERNNANVFSEGAPVDTEKIGKKSHTKLKKTPP